MRVQMHVGTIVAAAPFAAARKPAYQLTLDFGPLGMRRSSAQLTTHYTPECLVGQQVVAVLNLAPKQIANFMSECLVLGAMQADDGVILLQPERAAPNGTRIG